MAKFRLRLGELREHLARRQPAEPVLPLPGTRYTPSAVLMPLFLKDGEHHLLFTRRTLEVEYYKGHISFPGGAHDPADATPQLTALRETAEEIGLQAADVEVVGELDSIYSAGGFLIIPFLGVFPHPYPFQPSPAEVAELLEVPLGHLLDRRFSRQEPRPDGQMGYFFDWRGNIIWGSTGRIVHQLLEIITAGDFLERLGEEAPSHP